MSNLFSNAVSSVGKAVRKVANHVMDWNTSTFSGAVDIIVVRKMTEDGYVYSSTPFHVKFGIFQVMKSSDRAVTIELNGEIVPLTMKLTKNGFAYFSSDGNLAVWPDPAGELESAERNICVVDKVRPRRIRSFSEKMKKTSANVKSRMKKSLSMNDMCAEYSDPREWIIGQNNFNFENKFRLSLCKDKLSRAFITPRIKANRENVKIFERYCLDKSHIIDMFANFYGKGGDDNKTKFSNLVVMHKNNLYQWEEFSRYFLAKMAIDSDLEFETFMSSVQKKQKPNSSLHETEKLPIEKSTKKSSDYLSDSTTNVLPKRQSRLGKHRNSSSESLNFELKQSRESSAQKAPQLKVTTRRNPTEEKSASRSSMRAPSSFEEEIGDYLLTPTSEELAALPLNDGENVIRFIVTSSLQGTQIVEAAVHLWDVKDKIVVSDIDGTITRSDVLGFILPNFGNDWAHFGVAKLFRRIRENGYRVLYLTARLSSLTAMTRKYLFGLVESGGEQLPAGPILSVPFSLTTAYRRDHNRRPQEMKIQTLKDVLSLFEGRSALYAGFGNKETDAISYAAARVPSPRVFIINKTSEIIKHESKHSYLSLLETVDEIFPPIDPHKEHCDVEFGLNYWKEPAKNIDEISIE